MRVWMDQGGTFTDVLYVGPDGRARLRKVLSDRADLAGLAEEAAEVRRGSTVATNALLERKGAPVLLITTEGLGDLPWIGDGTRPALFDPRVHRQPPLCARVLEVPGRIAADGALLAPHRLDEDLLREARAAGIAAVAVVLVHGPLRPSEELTIGEFCIKAGFQQVSLGHRVAPSRGFLARLETTLADAALSPLLPRAPGLYMRSDGGLARAEEWRGCDAVLSGPAGGVIATAALARSTGMQAAFGLDMGGTSTDVCRVLGAPERADHLRIAGLTLRVPAVRLETVAAGGGSILSVRAGVYVVGPRSAGADPGPAAYGRGGPATLTDAEVVLGRLPVFPVVCGPGRDAPLDLAAARAALAALDPDRPVEEVALGFRAVADETMARAVSRLAARLGVDPTEHALVAFGGAGPAHATAIASRLGMRTVLIPLLASGFSAVGVGLARRRAEVVIPVRDSPRAALRRALASLPFSGRVDARLALRHLGTAELIEVPAGPELPDDMALDSATLAHFHEAHRARYGFERPGRAVEAVELRCAVEEENDHPRPILLDEGADLPASVSACFEGWREVPVRSFAEADGTIGPALLVGAGTTVVLEPGWRARLAPDHLELRDEGAARPRLGTSFDPVHTAIIGTRLSAVAENMGELLARLARSVSIRERRDFSCAVFDAGGRLVVNAPHVPVHLGAMGVTVRDLLSCRGALLGPGQVWASNDPYAGGSHLPDITAIAPIFRAGQRVGFVGCRGHHVDVGGATPGSMPPYATTLAEEGLVLRHVLLASDGRFHAPELPGCREPETVLADLEAQVAACALGVQGWNSLADNVGDQVLEAQLGHLLGSAAEAARALLRGLPDGDHVASERLDDGTTLRVHWQVRGERARLTVHAPRSPGNLNAPRAVAIAALLYVLRTLVQEDLPLNEGALEPVTLELEPGGLLDPQPPAAVAGGNVETSQRLVDALLRALGAQAASQGTMNNLTVGTDRGAWYETIGGGGGAGPGFSGLDGAQVHMTNTRATDVEELECRFPVRLLRWALRRSSGGEGALRGGDGLVKSWEFLAAATVALLAGRRLRGAPGLHGGAEGAPGEDLRDQGAGWGPAPPCWSANPGDRLMILTPGGGGYGAGTVNGEPTGGSAPAPLEAPPLSTL